MMDNKKEYIVCAAYKLKKGVNFPRIQEKIDNGHNIKEIYFEPHREVFDMALGWRHADIIYKHGDLIDKSDMGGFMTSKGRYVDSKEAAKIAFECEQVHTMVTQLYSEDIY